MTAESRADSFFFIPEPSGVWSLYLLGRYLFLVILLFFIINLVGVELPLTLLSTEIGREIRLTSLAIPGTAAADSLALVSVGGIYILYIAMVVEVLLTFCLLQPPPLYIEAAAMR